jgi:hypothetical protein
MGNNNYFCKFDFLASLPEVKTYFEKEYPIITSKQEEFYVLIGDDDKNPADTILESYANTSFRNKYPVTLVGYVRLNARWFSNLLERKESPEYFDILIRWTFGIVSWLQNMIDAHLLSAVMACGKRREPKFYFAFMPEFFGTDELTLSESAQAKVLSEIEDKFVEFLLTTGFPAVHITSDVVRVTIHEFCQCYKNLKKNAYVEPPTLPDAQHALTSRDLLTFFQGKDAVQERISDITKMALRDFASELNKHAKVWVLYSNMLMKRHEMSLAGMNYKYKRIERKHTKSEKFTCPDLRLVFHRLYGVSEQNVKFIKENEYEVVLNNGRKFCVNGQKWYEDDTNFEGDGGIALVNHLSGYPPTDQTSALHELASVFPKDIAKKFYIHNANLTIHDVIARLKKEPYKFPILSEELWESAMLKLQDYLLVPKNMLQFFHENGLLLCDKWGCILYVCDQKSGVFRTIFRKSQVHALIEQPTQDALPFFLPGKRKKVIITENPIVALKVKGQEFEADVLAYGVMMPIVRLLGYIQDKDIVVYSVSNTALPKALTEFLIRYGFHFQIEYGYVKDKKCQS